MHLALVANAPAYILLASVPSWSQVQLPAGDPVSHLPHGFCALHRAGDYYRPARAVIHLSRPIAVSRVPGHVAGPADGGARALLDGSALLPV